MASAATKVSPGPSEDFIAGMFAPLAFVIIVCPIVASRSWVIAVLWNWYVVPAFGVSPLRMVYAFGISLLVTYVLPRSVSEKTDGLEITVLRFCLNAAFTLLLGWVGTFFI